jgi:hypothetical protein
MIRDGVALAAQIGGATPIERRRLLKVGGVGLGVVVAGGLITSPFRSALAAFVGRPQAAQPNVDVQVFQTAASLENVAVEAYASVRELPFIRENATIARFVEATMQHHAEHSAAFNAKAESLGGTRQDALNPRYAQLVDEASPTLTDVDAVVQLAATLEEVFTDTYLADVALLADPTARTLLASVMAVESQHLAVLRTVAALVAAGRPDLATIPTDVNRLPAAIGSAALPGAFETPNLASPPTEGAVR